MNIILIRTYIIKLNMFILCFYIRKEKLLKYRNSYITKNKLSKYKLSIESIENDYWVKYY